jgi:hypothetical protein
MRDRSGETGEIFVSARRVDSEGVDRFPCRFGRNRSISVSIRKQSIDFHVDSEAIDRFSAESENGKKKFADCSSEATVVEKRSIAKIVWAFLFRVLATMSIWKESIFCRIREQGEKNCEFEFRSNSHGEEIDREKMQGVFFFLF